MKTVLSFILSIIIFRAAAQNVSIKWIEELEQKRSFGGLPAFDEAIQSEDGGSIRIENKYKGLFYKLEEQSLIKVSKSGKVEKTKVFTEKEMEDGILSTIAKLKNNYSIFRYQRRTDNSEFDIDLVINEFDTKNLSIAKEKFKIGFKLMGSATSFSASQNFINYSNDSAFAVIQLINSDKKAKMKGVNYIKLSATGEVLYIKGKSWVDDLKKIEINQPSIDNNGIIYTSYNVFEKDYDENFYSGKITPNSNYKTYYLQYADQKVNETKLVDIEQKFLKENNYMFQTKGREKMVGMYKNVYDGRIAGLYYTIPQGSFDQKLMYLPFPDSLLKRIEKNKQGKASGKDIGLDDAFIIKDVVDLPQGDICIFMQFTKTTKHSTLNYDKDTHRTKEESYVEVEQGDFLFCILSPDGQTKYQIVKHNQKTPDPMFYLEKNKLLVVENKLLLFFYDHPDNFEMDEEKKVKQLHTLLKADFVLLILDKKINIIEKKLIYNIIEEDKVLPFLKFNKVGKNSYSIMGYEPTFLGSKLKKGILTIK